jgi:hypothetical protein
MDRMTPHESHPVPFDLMMLVLVKKQHSRLIRNADLIAQKT